MAEEITEIDDQTLLTAMSKKLGKEIKSFDDFTPKTEPTAEEIQKANEKRDNEKTAWALQSGKVTAKQLKDFADDNSNKTGLLYSDYLATQKELNPNVDEDDVKVDFEKIVSRLGKSFDKATDAILKTKYPEIYNLDNEYNAYEGSLKKAAEEETKIKTDSPVFIAMNNEILDGFTTNGVEIELPAKENEQPVKFKFEPPKDAIEKLKNKFGSDAEVRNAVLKGFDKEKQEYVLKAAAIQLSIQDFARQIAEQAVFNRDAIIRGLAPDKRRTASTEITVADEVVEENTKVAKAYLRSQL